MHYALAAGRTLKLADKPKHMFSSNGLNFNLSVSVLQINPSTMYSHLIHPQKFRLIFTRLKRPSHDGLLAHENFYDGGTTPSRLDAFTFLRSSTGHKNRQYCKILTFLFCSALRRLGNILVHVLQETSSTS